MDFKKETVGGRVSRVRQERGLTQEYISELLGISQSAYSKLEKNGRKISAEELVIICSSLSVDANYILGMEEIPKAAVAKAPSKKEAPKLSLTVTFTEDDSVPDGPLVRRLNEIIRQLNDEGAA